MPAYDQPIRIHLPTPAERNKDSVAAVIKFTAGPEEMRRIQAFLDRLAERGIIEAGSVAKEYDSSYTSPELFFP